MTHKHYLYTLARLNRLRERHFIPVPLIAAWLHLGNRFTALNHKEFGTLTQDTDLELACMVRSFTALRSIQDDSLRQVGLQYGRLGETSDSGFSSK
jgi:hypothetical protein